METTYVAVDVANVMGQMGAQRCPWLEVRDSLLSRPGTERLQMELFAHVPPMLPEYREAREASRKFVSWAQSQGMLVTEVEGAPRPDGGYKADVDCQLTLSTLEFVAHVHPREVVILSADGDFAPLALALRRRGIRVTAGADMTKLARKLRLAVDDVFDLRPIFDVRCAPVERRSLAALA